MYDKPGDKKVLDKNETFMKLVTFSGSLWVRWILYRFIRKLHVDFLWCAHSNAILTILFWLQYSTVFVCVTHCISMSLIRKIIKYFISHFILFHDNHWYDNYVHHSKNCRQKIANFKQHSVEMWTHGIIICLYCYTIVNMLTR